MHTDRRQVHTCRHSRKGQIISEIKMCAVCLVGKKKHIMFFGNFGNSFNIGTNSVISGIIDKNGFCVRILLDFPFYFFGADSQGNTEFFVYTGIEINRDTASNDKSIYNASVNVSRQNDFLFRFNRIHNHSLNGCGSSVNYKKSLFGAESFGGKSLSFFYYSFGIAKIVERLH